MRETEYAYAVARIRANELGLLNSGDIDSLINTENITSALRLLSDKGYDTDSGISSMCEKELQRVWNLITECVPDSSLLEALVCANDFSNLKAAIKATFSDLEIEDYFAVPALCPLKTVSEAIGNAEFGLLPDYLASCAETAYHLISGGKGGQAAEMVLDKASAETRLSLARKSGSELLVRIIELVSLVSCIKIAKRCAANGKPLEFAFDAMPAFDFIDTAKIIDAAYNGSDISAIVREAGYTEIADEADGDFSALEMKCDNVITALIQKAKFDTFGPDPVVAFYFAKLAEVKNIRIILSAKQAGVPTDIIRERVRDIYV